VPTNPPSTSTEPAWKQGTGFWKDVKRQDTAPSLPSDEIY